MYYANDLVEKIKKAKKIYVYGAGIVADEVASCLTGEPYKLNIEAFIVSKMNNNPNKLHGKPVITFEEFRKNEKDNCLIIVACLEKVKNEIIQNLEDSGYKNYISLSFECDDWSNIRANYIMEYFRNNGLEYRVLNEMLKNVECSSPEDKVEVYRAVSSVDRQLTEDISRYDWEKKIQVGAALTDNIVTTIRDDVGENISAKNRMYCELTALYWMWKNTNDKYLGLCHYRRHFMFTEEERAKIPNSDIDVILTVPIANFPNIRAIYARDHLIEDWEVMKKAISIKYPEYSKDVEMLERGKVYFAYNMFVARREIFDKYCSFLFDILGYCEQNCVFKTDAYQNRYLGFLGERLLSVFMFHHFNDYKIAIANKHFAE